MRFAFVRNGVIEQTDVMLPGSARLLTTDELVSPPGGLAFAGTELREACGYFEIVETSPPAVAANQRYSSAITLVSGLPTVTWTIRSETVAEATDRVRQDNLSTITTMSTLETKMNDLKSFLADADVQFMLDLPNATMPTAQQLNRAIKAIIRQQRRAANFDILLARATLHRYQQSLLDSIVDT